MAKQKEIQTTAKKDNKHKGINKQQNKEGTKKNHKNSEIKEKETKEE